VDEKILNSILLGRQDKNIRFDDLRKILMQLGFKERIKGDHFIYKYHGIPERVNIQPDGNMAKGYQVRQIRTILMKYELVWRATNG